MEGPVYVYVASCFLLAVLLNFNRCDFHFNSLPITLHKIIQELFQVSQWDRSDNCQFCEMNNCLLLKSCVIVIEF